MFRMSLICVKCSFLIHPSTKISPLGALLSLRKNPPTSSSHSNLWLEHKPVWGTCGGAGTNTDTDKDGIPNGSDSDVDGDGTPNALDRDIDGDGIWNRHDSDIDGDGIANGVDPDADGDGVPDVEDATPGGNG